MLTSKYLATNSALCNYRKGYWQKIPTKLWPYIFKENTNNIDFTNTGICVGKQGGKQESI